MGGGRSCFRRSFSVQLDNLFRLSPPPCNTGVEYTDCTYEPPSCRSYLVTLSGLTAIDSHGIIKSISLEGGYKMIDYLTLTGNETEAFDYLLDLFNARGQKSNKTNRLNYSYMLNFNGCSFFWKSAPVVAVPVGSGQNREKVTSNLAFCVQISGEGMQYLRNIENGISDLFRCARCYSLKCTRIDINQDFRFSMEDVARSFYNHKTIFRASAYKYIKTDKGDTLYIGSRESEVFLRIYDKMSEMLGCVVNTMQLTRVEFELKGACARTAFAMVAGRDDDNTDALFNSLVARQIKITDLPLDQTGFKFQAQTDLGSDVVKFIEYCRAQLPVFVVYSKLIGLDKLQEELTEASLKPLKTKYIQMLKSVGIYCEAFEDEN